MQKEFVTITVNGVTYKGRSLVIGEILGMVKGKLSVVVQEKAPVKATVKKAAKVEYTDTHKKTFVPDKAKKKVK